MSEYLVQPEPIPAGNCLIRILKSLCEIIRSDLRRPHPFAFERVGFLSVASASDGDSGICLIAKHYHSVPDNQYVEGRGAGARIGADAIREAMQATLDTGLGIFHVHLHDEPGTPDFSPRDRAEQPRLVDSFVAVASSKPHGMFLLSSDSFTAWVWLPTQVSPMRPRKIVAVGYPLSVATVEDPLETLQPESERHSRQSFLGDASEKQLRQASVGVVGYGGGGSHIGIQLAHLGIGTVRIADGDRVSSTNLNRLVSAGPNDVSAEMEKVNIARRIMTSINPTIRLETHFGRWQDKPDFFRSCDVIIGCVDSFSERREIEIMARRFCIPYIDIGMDVIIAADEPPRMAGQVILSMPGSHCLTCVGFLSDARLAEEAARYGDAGDRPQVIWPNGILASSAVGILIDILTGWTATNDRGWYLSYDGNGGTVSPHVRSLYLSTEACPHFPAGAVGLPGFRSV